MATKYLLPCQCGASLSIDVGQAGQSLTCECGRALSVPTMREISRLERVEVANARRPPIEWNRLQGTMFSSGILVVVVALLASGYFTYVRTVIPVLEQPKVEQDERLSSDLAKMSPTQVLETWQSAEKMGGLGPWFPPEHVQAREARAAALRYTFIALGVALGGVFLAASSYLVKSPASKG